MIKIPHSLAHSEHDYLLQLASIFSPDSTAQLDPVTLVEQQGLIVLHVPRREGAVRFQLSGTGSLVPQSAARGQGWALCSFPFFSVRYATFFSVLKKECSVLFSSF